MKKKQFLNIKKGNSTNLPFISNFWTFEKIYNDRNNLQVSKEFETCNYDTKYSYKKNNVFIKFYDK